MKANGDHTPENPCSSAMDENKKDGYRHLQLGLVQTLIFKLSKNNQISVNTAIIFSIALSVVDIFTDILLFVKLLYQEQYVMAGLLAVVDFIPGVLLLLHHYASSMWSRNSALQKVGTFCLFLLQPFSLFLANSMWLRSLSASAATEDQDHHHYMARISSLFHGLIEGPLNFLLVAYMWSFGILPLPWQEVTAFLDDNSNYIYLGKITTASLALTTIGILKASADVFEGYDDKIKILLFSTTNITFRVLSFSYLIPFFRKWIIILFLVILTINLLFLLKTNDKQRIWIATISSTFCSVMVPVMMTDQPHIFQLLNVQSPSGMTKQKQNMEIMKRNACRLSFITNPIIFLADLMVVICMDHLQYKRESIWTDSILSHWFFYFFIPMFVITMLSTWFLSHPKKMTENVYPFKNTNPFNILEKIKMAFAQIPISIVLVLAVLGVVTNHAILAPKVSSAILGYTTPGNELFVMDTIISKPLPNGCEDDGMYVKCENIKFSNSDYRKIPILDDNFFYVDPSIETSRLPNTTYYFVNTIYDWEKMAQSIFPDLKCKRCMAPTMRCISYLHDIAHVQGCKGNQLRLAYIR